MSENKDLEEKLAEIEKYIYDPNKNHDLVLEKIKQDKLSKRRKAYREKKLKIKSDSEEKHKKVSIKKPKKQKKISKNKSKKKEEKK